MSERTPKDNYVAEPEIPADLRERHMTILEVISGMTSMSEGARRLKVSRNYFQTLVHKTQEARSC